MAKRKEAQDTKPGGEKDSVRHRQTPDRAVDPGEGKDSLHELEDRLGYLKRMLRAEQLALHVAHDEHEAGEANGPGCCLIELVEDELECLADLAESLEGKALAARLKEAV